ncbi:MAG: SEC-C domain-containing protein [Blautia sp.]|nr:SEC-C domain-containing protein [Blautia sp.]
MEQYYAILGIEKGASEKELKRAYVRQIRLHTPEKDPEGFRKIRDAYEKLTQTDPQDEEASFAPVEEGFQKLFYEQIETLRANHRTAAWRDKAQEAYDQFPQTTYFLYQLVLAQISCGNYRKAIKNAEELVKREPDNKWYLEQLGRANNKNGYNNKAVAAFEKAYQAGNRSLEFLCEYAELNKERRYYERAFQTAAEGLQGRAKRWNRENINSGVRLYRVTGSTARFVPQKDLIPVISEFADFVASNIWILQNWKGSCYNCAYQLMDAASPTGKKEEISREVSTALAAIGRGIYKLYGEMDQDVWELLSHILDSDYRLNEHTINLIVAMNAKDKLSKKAFREAQLFALKEREQVLSDRSMVEKEYPFMYQNAESFFELLSDNKKSEIKKSELLRDLGRSLASWDDSESLFLKAYPEEKKAIFGTQVATGMETYVREKKKIGRNDPCPCGSGRKFKQCCMGKGIYD